MGLDMMLYRQTAELPPMGPAIEAAHAVDTKNTDWDKVFNVQEQYECVAYWRKANMIHAWFVDNFQDGVDECQYSKPIGKEALAGLVERCRRILDGAPLEDLLPTRGGFFFGPTSDDPEATEWFRMKLQETIDQLEPLIAERNADQFVYHSSW